MLYASVLLFTFLFAALIHVFIELPLAKLWVSVPCLQTKNNLFFKSIALKKIQKSSGGAKDIKPDAQKEVLQEEKRTSQTSL